jgi:hypothetical protein
MSLLTRKRTVLAKIESVYGTDPTPTGSANAMLVTNLNFNPVQASQVSRDLIRPYLGNSESLLAEKYVQVSFEVEMAGAGAAGSIPAYDCLLRACAMTKAVNTAAITSLTQTGGVATAALTAHGYNVGDKVLISGASVSAYNGVQTITAKTTNTFSFTVPGGTTTPDAGTPVVNTSVVYSPVSSSFESVTIYYNVDGVLHKMVGAMGNVELNLAVKNIPRFKFTFTGLYVSPADVVAPSVDYSAFQIPFVANTQNTPGFSLFSYSGNMESMALQIANDVQYIPLIGTESVKILDRKPAGTLVFEAPTITSKDFFSLVANQTKGAVQIKHGTVAGQMVQFDAPAALLGNPTYQDSNGVQMLSTPFTLNPVSGNDEFTITIK